VGTLDASCTRYREMKASKARTASRDMMYQVSDGSKRENPPWHAYYQKGRDLDGKQEQHFFARNRNGKSSRSVIHQYM